MDRILFNKLDRRSSTRLTCINIIEYLLTRKKFPRNKVLAQERSFEIFHNEKYISHEGGKQLLEKVKVWNLLEIWPIADPISFAIHPELLSRDKVSCCCS